MKLYEAITILAILVGPVLAVIVQIRNERRKQNRDNQNTTLRMLIGTRHLPSDPAYSTAINMIPIDFNSVPTVMLAHKGYIDCILYQPSSENLDTHNQQILAKQTQLIFEMTKFLGYDLSETDIQTSAYAAGGFIARDNLMLDAWRSWPRIAQALETQTQWIGSQQGNEKK